MSYGWHGGVCRVLFLFVCFGGGGGGGLYIESTVSVVTDETAKSSRYDMNKSTNISYYGCVAFHVIIRVWLSHGIFNVLMNNGLRSACSDIHWMFRMCK